MVCTMKLGHRGVAATRKNARVAAALLTGDTERSYQQRRRFCALLCKSVTPPVAQKPFDCTETTLVLLSIVRRGVGVEASAGPSRLKALLQPRERTLVE